MHGRRGSPGFSLTSAVVAIAVLAVLAVVMVPRVAERRAAARDAQRNADLERVRAAIERFRLAEGRLPAAEASAAYGGWDVSHDGAFVPELVERGYLAACVHDPIDDDEHHFSYAVFPAGAYGCATSAPFFVLGIRRFETAGLAQLWPRAPACRERDWSDELERVVIGGAASRDLAKRARGR